MEEQAISEMARCPHWRVVHDHSPCNPETTPCIRANIEPWGASSWLVAEKVIFDHIQGVTVMARGLELLQENSLYMYLCGIFGYRIPNKMIYIPRLMTSDGKEMTDVSKTLGTWKVRDLRDRGFAPCDILETLRQSCLIDSDGPWLAKNVKLNPVLEGPLVEAFLEELSKHHEVEDKAR
jgi:hypothetical protein